MDVSLGVSMTPTAVRIVLVEGDGADGATVDHQILDVTPGSSAAERAAAAILGTRKSAAEDGHRVVSAGVAWKDHAAAAELRQILRENGVDDVVLVSELHATSALAQAVGRAMGYRRTALMLLDGDSATVAVVRTDDGAVVRVHTRGLRGPEAAADLQDMIGRLTFLDEAPEALFLAGGSGDAASLSALVADRVGLPVHAPGDAELALARGAALASATAPRYEAETVGLPPADDTEAAVGRTEPAGAAYMAPLGYSAVHTEADADEPGSDPDSDAAPEGDRSGESSSFLLVGSALAALFVVGVAALVMSLVVTIRPAVQERPAGAVGSSQVQPPEAPEAPETIQAPVPVVQEAPRTVYVRPAAPAVVAPQAPVALPAPAAPAPAPEATPAPVAPPAAAAPAPDPAPAVAPVPVPVPIVVPAAPPRLPPFLQGPFRRPPRSTPAVQSPEPATPPAGPSSTAPSSTAPTAVTPTPSGPAVVPAPATTPAPATSATEAPQSGSTATDSGKCPRRNGVCPLWPFGG